MRLTLESFSPMPRAKTVTMRTFRIDDLIGRARNSDFFPELSRQGNLCGFANIDSPLRKLPGARCSNALADEDAPALIRKDGSDTAAERHPGFYIGVDAKR